MLKKYFVAGAFILLAFYVAFQGRYVILGPEISIEHPFAESTVPEGVLLVTGRAQNISYLSLDDRQIYTDTTGHFEEKLIAEPGINIIKLVAKDRFGREKEVLVRVIAK